MSESMKAIVSSCLQQSTAHGITYVANGKTRVQRVAWLIFFLLACGAFGYTFTKNIQKYYAEDASLNVKLQGIAFSAPDIHFCNFRPLSPSRMLELEANLSTEWNSLTQTIQTLETVLQVANVTEGEVLNSIFWASLQTDQLYRLAGHYAHQSILSLPIPAEVSWNPYYFTCFRYQPDNQTLRFPSAQELYYLFSDDYHTATPAATYFGRTLDTLRYLTSASVDITGTVIYFSPRDNFPHPESAYTVVNPAQIGMVGLKMQQTVTANRAAFPCQTQATFVEYHNPLLGSNASTRYLKTVGDCRLAKTLQKMLSRNATCQCIPYMVPTTISMRQLYPTCGNVSLEIYQRPLNFMRLNEIIKQVNCMDAFYKYAGEFEPSECKDETPCTTSSYSAIVSTSHWTQEHILHQIVWDQLYWYFASCLRQNFSVPGLSRYFNDIFRNASLTMDLTQYNFAKIFLSANEYRSSLGEENVAYGIENLVSDVGGIAGLYLGMSFLTLLEFFNLFHDLISVVWYAHDTDDNGDASVGNVEFRLNSRTVSCAEELPRE